MATKSFGRKSSSGAQGGAALFEALGLSASMDKFGVYTIQVPYATDSEDAAMKAGPASYGAFKLVGRSIQAQEDGKTWLTTNTYSGADDSSGGDGPKPYGDDDVYEMSASWEEEPLQSHPKFAELMKKYGGTEDADGNVTWGKKMPGKTGGVNDNNKSAKANPMYGVTKWKRLGVVWSATRVMKSLPGGLLSNVGKMETPPGPAPSLPNNGAWLKLPPRASRRGNVWQVTEEWQMIDVNLPRELYEKAGGAKK